MITDLLARWRDERTAQTGIRLAEALQQRGEGVRAEEILAEVESGLESEPRDLASRVAVGTSRLALGQPAAAARMLEEVVRADPTHLKANKLLVRVYLGLGQRDRARDRLDLYRLLNEGDPEIEALEGLVIGVPARRATGAAEPAGGRSLSLAEDDPFADLTAAPAAPLADDLFFDLAPAPEPPTATATLGALYQEQGHTEEAEQAFREVIAEQPDNLEARDGLAALTSTSGVPAAAGEEAPRAAPAAFAAELDPEVDRERRIGILRDYLERIQRARGAAAR